MERGHYFRALTYQAPLVLVQLTAPGGRAGLLELLDVPQKSDQKADAVMWRVHKLLNKTGQKINP